jgi:hypothetical protein
MLTVVGRNQMRFHIVDHRSLFASDYGDILLAGCAPRDDDDGLLHIMRTGPFLPPLWTGGPGDNLMVSDNFRLTLESAGFSSVTFRETVYEKIVNIPWHEWDLDADEPQEYPESGEPDDYLFDEPHDEALAATMEPTWEVVLPKPPCNVIIGDRFWDATAEMQNAYQYPQLFYGSRNAPRFPVPIVNDAGKDWFMEHAGEWVSFRELKLDYQETVKYPTGPSR